MYKISNNSEVVIFLLGEMRWNDSFSNVYLDKHQGSRYL